MRIHRSVPAAAALILVAVLGVVAAKHDFGGALALPIPVGRACVVQADGQVELSAEQMANAATITAVGVRRKMPERAIVVALATAFQESKLENLAGGDRDSIGLFQQRPSQGWGTVEQISDPRYAAGKFYASLKKVRGWQDMRVTDAAQAVQRSAFPGAYEKWAGESTVLMKALLGHATGAVSCTLTGEPAIRGAAAATALANGLRLDWGKLDGATPAELGLAVTVGNERAGWRYAHWLVSHASDHGVRRVVFGDLEWKSDSGDWTTAPADRTATAGQVIAEVFG